MLEPTDILASKLINAVIHCPYNSTFTYQICLNSGGETCENNFNRTHIFAIGKYGDSFLLNVATGQLTNLPDISHHQIFQECVASVMFDKTGSILLVSIAITTTDTGGHVNEQNELQTLQIIKGNNQQIHYGSWKFITASSAMDTSMDRMYGACKY